MRPQEPDIAASEPNVLSHREQEAQTRGPEEAVLKLELLKDLWDFMRVRKKFWLFLVILILALSAALIVFVHGSAIAPFIYTLF